jgi:hypothetical protein
MATSDARGKTQAERRTVSSAAAGRGRISPRSASGKIRPRIDVVSADRRWMDAGLLDQDFVFADW